VVYSIGGFSGGIKMNNYEIEWYSQTDDCMKTTSLTMKDLADFFLQIRGFPSILFLGSIAGEGQSGGRFITECAKDLERAIIDDLGMDEYTRQMDEMINPHRLMGDGAR